MTNKRYIAYCEICGFKKILEDPTKADGLISLPKTIVQGGIPYLSKETGKTGTRPNVEAMPKYRCPKCGRSIAVKKYLVPETKEKTEEKAKDENDSNKQN